MWNMDWLLHYGGPTVGLSLASIGLGMIRLEEFKIARRFFWTGAIVFSLPCFLWQLTTQDPFGLRLLSGAIASVSIFVVFPAALRWLRKRELMAGRS